MNASSAETANPSRALLAEDDALIRELVASYLDQLGYQVLEASNGAMAIEIMFRDNADKFDLIVTDILMPKADGETLVQRARELGKCDRFLLMSGNPVDLDSRKVDGAADCAYIEKPFTFGAFTSMLRTLRETTENAD